MWIVLCSCSDSTTMACAVPVYVSSACEAGGHPHAALCPLPGGSNTLVHLQSSLQARIPLHCQSCPCSAGIAPSVAVVRALQKACSTFQEMHSHRALWSISCCKTANTQENDEL